MKKGLFWGAALGFDEWHFSHHKRAMKPFRWPLPPQSRRGKRNTDTQFKVWALGDSRSRSRSQSGDHLQLHLLQLPRSFFLYKWLLDQKTRISHLNLLICALDSISEVLINLFFFVGDAFAMMISLCFGFIQPYFLLSVVCVWSLFCKCCNQKIMFLSDDLCVLLAAWCF